MEERAERQRGRDRLVDAERRLKRIANEHQKHVDGHGGTYGECNDCGWQWPCPTYQWATATVTDVNCTWDLTDCEFEHDHFAAHPGTDTRDDGSALLAAVERRRQDPEFMARIRASIAEHKPILDRLADDEAACCCDRTTARLIVCPVHPERSPLRPDTRDDGEAGRG